MDLMRQPPRRPSNLSVAGLVGAARMTDKARAHNDETLGDYVYGENSGLDRKILGFLSISADDFAEAADEYGDDALSGWMLEKSGKTQAEIDEFNQTELSHEPDTAEARERLRARLEEYAPGRTDIKTAIQSMELDDWGEFWPVDLTKRPPRSPHCKDVAGICGIAQMADKARAVRAGKFGEYRFGDDSTLDRHLLGFLGSSADEFQEAAVNNSNDLELGAWVLEKSGLQPDRITAFNRAVASAGPESEDDELREFFYELLQAIDPSRTDIKTLFDLVDLNDELSFGIVDLARHAPRSPYNTDLGGIIHLARMVDKARAYNSDSLGEYWYGEDSGVDRNLLAFLDISPEEFAEALKGLPTDADVANWLKTQSPKTESEIADYNEEAVKMGPTNDRQRAFLAKVINKLDPSRTDIQTFFELMVLDDQKSFV